jgi:hypothetical protein
MKLHEHKGLYFFYCPGCKCGHHFNTIAPGPIWDFNGNTEKPTFTPSLRIFTRATNDYPEKTHCHLFLTDGRIQFLTDCAHDLKGTTVDMVDFPENYGLPGK